jgi:D-3-phosphoglycerate dehydrogenase / 2-oxoglutarate reductase
MKTFLILDFDSTFVRVEALDELARIALRDAPDREERVARIAAITKEGMEGKIGFGESLARRLKLFAPTQAQIDEVIRLLKARVTPSFEQHRSWIAQNAGRIYVISGGFREYIGPVVREFGIADDHVLANEFVRDASGAVTGCDTANPLAMDEGKVKAIRQLGLKGRVVMAGDGWSDYLARLQGAADEFVAFTENVKRPAVVAGADAVARDFGEVMARVV